MILLAIALHRGNIALGDVEVGLGLIDLRLRRDVTFGERVDAVVIGLGFIASRLLRCDSRVERLHL